MVWFSCRWCWALLGQRVTEKCKLRPPRRIPPWWLLTAILRWGKRSQSLNRTPPWLKLGWRRQQTNGPLLEQRAHLLWMSECLKKFSCGYLCFEQFLVMWWDWWTCVLLHVFLLFFRNPTVATSFLNHPRPLHGLFATKLLVYCISLCTAGQDDNEPCLRLLPAVWCSCTSELTPCFALKTLFHVLVGRLCS